ncbi:uncharacterized protein ACLA_052300 [Aspergillus clavatus NRRL 1]|uniref:Uncharacterized protein n=1 Tax=Aspergillus clavatus (strain ATCC 1007 / CBS 513.65 / DSM 816 / NCTC 3887 / NRRL 1 / QM 1276 / 107) TaxID=344612 RepID=A1CIQ2_ASPCL|nr:uncharacterized protein ACLA_052300 [Aspergillus clavatus NRRL 1]EAW10757.1 conserved hypothetical protein [Aspergillus clavatus NRRL 1]
MGVDTRRPILPAPTESLVDTTGGSTTGTDLATDISRRTDKTSYSIPDDGSPVTISTRWRHRDRGDDSKLSRSSHHSQTSLLIEYFEGGKGSGSLTSRPSVRVRVTPSSARKLKEQKDHIQISESSGNRRPVYTRRISFSSPSKQKNLVEPDDNSVSSSNSAIDENQNSSRHLPVEIEFLNRDQGSELSSVSRDRYIPATSDISSMPADSLLEASSAAPRRKRSSSLDRKKGHNSKGYLKTPSRQRSRSLSTERIAHRVAEKLSNDAPETSTSKKSKVYRDDDMVSPESSLLSASAVSSHRKSGDQYSFRSGTSKSSINNPKLLETVEDAIRRLILPELKELKKDQKVISNTNKFERDLNASYTSSASSPSRDELGRRLSKHASAPDVMKPKVVLNKDSKDEGIVLSGDPNPTQKERRASKDNEKKLEPPYAVWANRPELTEQDKLRRQKSKGLRDAEKAGIVGTALTAAALQRHESQSSIDPNEDRRSEDRNHPAGGINETELVFQRHKVAPMPLRSAVETELTRDSLLSQQTAGTALPHEEATLYDVPRVSPLRVASPASRTPNRTPLDTRNELALKHSNLSRHNLSINSASDPALRDRDHSPVSEAAAGAIAAANLLDPHSSRQDSDFTDDPRRRTLSPIQSVASNQSDHYLQQYPVQHDDYEYPESERALEPRLSIESLSSAPSTSLARSTRPDGMASHSGILRHRDDDDHELGYEETPTLSPRNENWHEDSELYDPNYRHSMAETADSDGKRLTNYTDNSEVSYMQKISQGQRVAQGIGANPQFVQPLAVESAVASLLDPSILDTKSNQSGVPPQQNLPQMKSLEQIPQASRQGSPLKQRQDAASPDETSFSRRMGATSPPQSVTQSLEGRTESPNFYANEHRSVESPLPENREMSPDSESEINTNPSIIQGPAPGSNWAYNQTPPKADHSPYYHEGADAAAGSAGLGLGYNKDYYAAEDYGPDDYFDQPYAGGQMFGTPLGAKDEGYVSAANPLSPGADTPEPVGKGFGGLDAGGMGLFDTPLRADDPTGPSHHRNLSGYSHGIGSPLYDSATGRGIDRIQSKDIVALMDHLTVRDAQRNARDTEILVTLVKSAAEMRNSFEEMKKFIALQDGMIMDASDRQHERTYKAIGGPRPLPASVARSFRQSADDGEDLRSKRKNLFKRALKGLSLKSSNDLTKIEEMLEQLLEEVEALRAVQDDSRYARSGRAPSVDPEGYEPEGFAGSGSPGTHSGYLSTSSRPLQEARGNGQARGLEHRVSTVPEGDEDMDLDERGEFLSPNLPSQENAEPRRERADSLPLSTSPRVPVASGALSNETSPKTTEKARKHKSSSSSFFPKISRWSKTTASSMGDNIRNSIQPGRKDRPYYDTSRSGSDVAHGAAYKAGDWYDPHGDDRLRSNYTLNDQQQQENRPPSPLVPSQVSEAPKYRAHRGSLDLQHPQPRQGPTGRYQNQLESQAQVYGAPMIGATSDQWGSNPSLSAVNPNQNRFSAASRLSPISDAGYSQTSSRTGQQGPPRPPKVKDEGPLIPERSPKVKEDERAYTDRVASQSSIVRSPRATPSPRKPTGPRPLTSGNQYSPARRKRSEYRASPDQVDDEHDY